MELGQYAHKPFITWGIMVAAISGMEDHFRRNMGNLGLSDLNISVNFPYKEQIYPNIILSFNSIEISQSGLFSGEMTDPVSSLLKSSGEIGVQIWSESHNQLMSLVDFVTQGYLMTLFEKTALFHPELDKSYVNMMYGGGKLSWSSFSLAETPDSSESQNRAFSTSTSFPLIAEHHFPQKTLLG